MDAKKEATLRRVWYATDATGRDERLHRQVLYVEDDVNRLALGYAKAVIAGAVTGRYAPENLFRYCSTLLSLIGLDSDLEATCDYCSAIVQWYIDQLKGE